jgi:hypothetical protein
MLYQSDKGHFAWLPTSSDLEPVRVSQSDIICRSQAQAWLGVVQEGNCAGQTYDGELFSSPEFEILYQTK